MPYKTTTTQGKSENTIISSHFAEHLSQAKSEPKPLYGNTVGKRPIFVILTPTYLIFVGILHSGLVPPKSEAIYRTAKNIFLSFLTTVHHLEMRISVIRSRLEVWATSFYIYCSACQLAARLLYHSETRVQKRVKPHPTELLIDNFSQLQFCLTQKSP